MLCLQVAFILAYAISGYGFNPYVFPLYRGMAVFIELADLLSIIFFGIMRDVLKRGYYIELIRTTQNGLVVGAASILYLFLLQQGQMYSRLALLLMVVLYVLIAYTTRVIWKHYILRKLRGETGQSLLVVSTADIVESVVANIQSNNYSGFKVAGIVVVDGDHTGRSYCGVDVVATQETVAAYLCQEWIDEVLLITPEGHPFPKKLVDEMAETGVAVHYNLSEDVFSPERKHFIEVIEPYTVITTSMNYATTKQLIVKRLMDIAGGLLGCVATGIIFIFVAPMIYIGSPGPIFYSQERVGENGRRFKMYKFRSMYLDADEQKDALMEENKIRDGKMFKMDFDPRVIGNRIAEDGSPRTGIGDFLRRTSLDEFPQFFNVLKGDMSIVGTRPPLVSEAMLYESRHRARLAIKPGITGLWQVSGRSNITDFEEVVKLDKEYINNWSIHLDIKILLKTISVVLREEGSA